MLSEMKMAGRKENSEKKRKRETVKIRRKYNSLWRKKMESERKIRQLKERTKMRNQEAGEWRRERKAEGLTMKGRWHNGTLKESKILAETLVI